MIYNSIPGVPNFVSEEFVQKRSSYCICIPIINEGRRIHDELKRARKYKIDTIADIIICDGGSIDGLSLTHIYYYIDNKKIPDNGFIYMHIYPDNTQNKDFLNRDINLEDIQEKTVLPFKKKALIQRPIPVSYTHIDVYKRQVPLDADDLIIPTYLEYVYWGLKCHPEASWCYTDSLGFQEECYLWKKAFSSEKMKKENLLVCTAAIRKKDLMAVGGYDESNQHYDEDWKLWLELLAMGKYPIHLSVFGFWYRRTASGMGNQVRINRDLKNCSDSLVQQSAQKITKVIEAIEYPRQSSANLFSKPVCSNWTYKIPQITEKKHILMLLPWLEMGGADLFNLELVKKLNKSIYEITIITTVNSSNTWKQRFEEYVSDIFTLPD